MSGWIVEQTDDQIVVNTDPRQAARITIKRLNIASITALPISLMPEGLLQVLTKDEIIDLLAYIEAGGDADAPPSLPLLPMRRVSLTTRAWRAGDRETRPRIAAKLS